MEQIFNQFPIKIGNIILFRTVRQFVLSVFSYSSFSFKLQDVQFELFMLHFHVS